MLGMYAGKERRNRVVASAVAIVLVAGVVLALLATVVQAGSAQALAMHVRLVSMVPSDGARLDHAPPQISLTFDDVVTPEFIQIKVTKNGTPVETSAATVERSVVTSRIIGDPGPGDYDVAWQVTADDGHPVTGVSTFLVGGAAASSRPKVTPTYKTPQTQPTTFGHPDHMPGLIVAAVLLLGGVALLWYEHRRRQEHHAPHDSPPQDSSPQDSSREQRIS